jgi:phosphatidylglycerophosphate synthase
MGRRIIDGNQRNPAALSSPLVRWSVFHSVCLLWATFYSLSSGALWPVVFGGAGSFLALLLSAHRHLTGRRILHAANLVTALRLVGILTLALIVETTSGFTIFAVGLGLMVADLFDGWLARNSNMESEFGDHFDKETDAFFTLALCLMVVVKGLLSAWVVTMGILRYVFILVLFFLKTEIRKEERSNRARSISTVAMMILLLVFLPLEPIRKPFAVLAICLLLFSFSRDFQKVLQRNKLAT